MMGCGNGSIRIDRRRFLAGAGGSLLAADTRFRAAAADLAADASRAEAMLIGSLIGDALGGPLEFKSPDEVREIMPAARRWPSERVIDRATKRRLAESLRMFSYVELRPQTAAYGPWLAKAERGTITDDSRHKIILMRALESMLADGRDGLTDRDLATEIIGFQPKPGTIPDADLAALIDEGLREYRYAARWLLGERDPRRALPVERLWSGIANCSGQMMLIPLAGLFPGDPERAYRATFQLDCVDAAAARDIAAAINAGLAAALDPKLDRHSTAKRWAALLEAMRRTDPYRYAEVPFAGRPLQRWLDLADSIVRRAEGRPRKIYELLESEGKPVYYWDAHFTLLVALTMLRACDFEPLSAMQLTLDFGHDTDSYAQLLGAMAGSVHGMEIFPISMRAAVEQRLTADYGESTRDWALTLAAARDVWSMKQQE